VTNTYHTCTATCTLSDVYSSENAMILTQSSLHHLMMIKQTDVPLEKAIARQWPMIEEHSARLRHMELYPKWGSLQLWVAPIDSEMDVAYNRPHVQFIQMFREVDGADKVRNVEIGFAGELYENGEEGFRTVRTADGKPAKPELQSEEKRKPTKEEVDEIMEQLQSQAPSDAGDDWGDGNIS
jgi:hypothetical protein